ncbi:MAG: hypothetical protein KOO63_15055 [Bacteroidales bacterium]|nr:hypothetical protein [Candidatus Latescibacterota bacterium]
MCRIGYLPTIMALLIVLAGCAQAPPAFDDISSTHLIDLADSTDSVELEKIFIDSHSWILGEIARREGSQARDTDLIEIKSIVIIAEEVYLQGNIVLAVKLLTEAELLLRQTP